MHAMLKEELQLHNISIGRDRFYELLRSHDLLIKRKKRYAVTTNSDHPYYKWARSFSKRYAYRHRTALGKRYYLPAHRKRFCLPLTQSQMPGQERIIGYHVSQHLKAQGCIIALNKAIASLRVEQKEKRKLLHHFRQRHTNIAVNRM